MKCDEEELLNSNIAVRNSNMSGKYEFWPCEYGPCLYSQSIWDVCIMDLSLLRIQLVSYMDIRFKYLDRDPWISFGVFCIRPHQRVCKIPFSSQTPFWLPRNEPL